MRFGRVACAAALAGTLLAPGVARATCGAEGCPFIGRGLGSDGHRFSFHLRYQEVTQDQLWNGTGEASLEDILADAEQHGEVELYTRTRSWVAEGRAELGDRLLVIATVPYIDREHQHMIRHTPTFNPLFVDTWKYDGLGDAMLLGQYTALRREGGYSLAVQGGVKLPTGLEHVPDEERDNFGFESTLEPGVRPGTGSTDWLAGALFSAPLPWSRALPLTASVMARFNGKGTDDYQVGDEIQAGLAGGWSALERVTLLGQVNFDAHDDDVPGEPGAHAAHSAIRSLFLTPGVSIRVASGLAVYGLYQWRVWGKSDEATVVANHHLLVGTSFSLGR